MSDEERMRRMSRKSFLWAAGSIVGTYGFWRWLNHSSDVDGLKKPFRQGLTFGQGVWSHALDPHRRVPTYPPSAVTAERMNDSTGALDDLDLDTYRIRVEGLAGRTEPLELTMADIMAMPSLTMTTEFFCIEGWSVIQTFRGVPFTEFMKRYPPATLSGRPLDLDKAPDDLPPYVYMETPALADDSQDELYYVGLDMRSTMHEQTMLCYSMNGKPLTPAHGAPLRLVIPVKYGVKNLKRIGLIRYQTTQPKDYWAEQGYDWFAAV